jgi:NAD(P)-dependent dehydrogenase (short-subunit alcohol dehydrogenase family)
MLLKDKIGLVTGGGSGIGRATAILFAAEGAKVAVADINEKGGNETVEIIKNAGGSAIFVLTDVSDQEQVRNLVFQTVKTFGRLDCAVNNAGISSGHMVFSDVLDEDWDAQIRVNLNGVRLCMKYELMEMKRQGSGAIVNISSGAGLTGVPRSGGYGAAKHAVVGMTKTAALDHALDGIRVNAVCPGFIVTPMTDHVQSIGRELNVQMLCPMGRPGRPQEIAEAVTWLCSDRASFVTGVPFPVDGGFMAD